MRGTIYNKTFWFVWNPRGGAPSYQHPSLDSASKEAERLAMLNPGQEFVVLESIGSVRKSEVQWTSHSDDVPF